MLVPYYHRNFKKEFKNLPSGAKENFSERLDIFLATPFAAILNNHPLHGEWKGYRSINVIGDIGAIFRIENNVAIFVAIGPHRDLYGR